MSKNNLGIRNIGIPTADDDRNWSWWNPESDKFTDFLGRLIKKDLNPDVLDADSPAMRTGVVVEIHGKDYFDTNNSISKAMPMDTDLRELGMGTIKIMSALDQMSLPPENWNHDPRKPNDGGSAKYKKRLLTVVVPSDELAKLQIGQTIQFSNPNMIFNKVLMKARPSVFIGKEPGCTKPKKKKKKPKLQKKGKAIPKNQIPGIDLSKKKQVTGWLNGKPKQIEVVFVKNYAGYSNSGRYLEIKTAKDFQKMREAAAKEGLKLNISSGFRSMESQKTLYACYKLGKAHRASRGATGCGNKKASDYVFNSASSSKIAKSMGSSRAFGAAKARGGKCRSCNLAAHPGWSDHQMGKAADVNTAEFSDAEIKRDYPNKTLAERRKIKKSIGKGALWQWLVSPKGARKFNFKLDSSEHWHYSHTG